MHLPIFPLTKGRATFFRQETIVAKFLCMMVLIWNAFINYVLKLQFMLLLWCTWRTFLNQHLFFSCSLNNIDKNQKSKFYASLIGFLNYTFFFFFLCYKRFETSYWLSFIIFWHFLLTQFISILFDASYDFLQIALVLQFWIEFHELCIILQLSWCRCAKRFPISNFSFSLFNFTNFLFLALLSSAVYLFYCHFCCHSSDNINLKTLMHFCVELFFNFRNEAKLKPFDIKV